MPTPQKSSKTVLPAGDEVVSAGPADAARALKRQCHGRLLRPWARNCAAKDRALKQHLAALRSPRRVAAGDDVALAVTLGAERGGEVVVTGDLPEGARVLLGEDAE